MRHNPHVTEGAAPGLPVQWLPATTSDPATMALEPARDPYRHHPQASPHQKADPEPAEARPPGRLPARFADLGRRLAAALSPGFARALAVTTRVPPPAAAAGAIGVAALVLALLAADGDGEFPGSTFEAGLLSRPPSPDAADASEAPEAPEAVAALANNAIAERLVEDPAFDLRPGGPAAGAEANELPLPLPQQTAGPVADGGARDPVAVLSAAVPAPADPTLRILERLRTRMAFPPADGMPPSAKAPAKAEPRVAIQLLAVGRRQLATEAWGRLQRDNADLLGRLQPTIVAPERKVSTLFRLRAGPVATAREAQSLCASLVRRGVDCIVVHGG